MQCTNQLFWDQIQQLISTKIKKADLNKKKIKTNGFLIIHIKEHTEDTILVVDDVVKGEMFFLIQSRNLRKTLA